jgi:tellurite resistance protein
LRELASREPEAKRAVLEAACLVSAADGEVDPAERDAISRLAGLLGADAETEHLDARLSEMSKMSATAAIADEADRVGARLLAADVVSNGVAAAAVVGLVSHGMSLGELAVLRRVADAARLPEHLLGEIVDSADAALTNA